MFVSGNVRLAADPQEHKNNDKYIADFRVASQRSYQRDNQPTADFFNCTAFGKTAETIVKYCKKGTPIYIRGDLRNNNYENKEGKMVYRDVIIIERFEFVPKNNGNPTAEGENKEAKNETPDGFVTSVDDLDEELPFN